MSNNPNEMSFLDHLEELRWHLIRATMSILIVATAAFIAKDFIFDVILFGPKKVDFFTYRLFCELSQSLGQGNSLCIDEMPFRIQSRTMSGQFSAHLWTSITAGFIIAFPYILFEFWRFISPRNESAKGVITSQAARHLEIQDITRWIWKCIFPFYKRYGE